MTIIRVIDLETSGTEPTDEVVEIAAVDVDTETMDFRIHGTDLVRTTKPIPPQASAIHHIIDADVIDAKLWDDVWPLYLTAEVGCYAAHNAAFESKWLGESMRQGVSLICTYKASLRVWPDAPKHSNQTLRYWRGLNVERHIADNSHRALPDAYVTAHLLIDLLKSATLADMDRWTAEPALLPTCPIGDEWRGKKWSEIDEGFLKWMIKKPVDDPDLVWNAQHELGRRWDEEANNRKIYVALAKSVIPNARSLDDLNGWFLSERDLNFPKWGITPDTGEYKIIVAACAERKAQLLKEQLLKEQEHASAA